MPTRRPTKGKIVVVSILAIVGGVFLVPLMIGGLVVGFVND
jgi:hypothetical protein